MEGQRSSVASVHGKCNGALSASGITHLRHARGQLTLGGQCDPRDYPDNLDVPGALWRMGAGDA